MQPIFHFAPERRPHQASLHDLIQLPLFGDAVDPGAIRDVVVDRLREGVRPLEHHPDPLPQVHHVHLAAVDVDAVDKCLADDLHPFDQIVHPVERTDERALPAARRTDERRHLVAVHRERYIAQRLLLTIVEGEGFRADLRLKFFLCHETQ
jgi:hypothetical protein